MSFKLKYKNSAFPFKTDEEEKRNKERMEFLRRYEIDKAIREGKVPPPEDRESVREYNDAIKGTKFENLDRSV
tara:strand:- start:342 stop:560 length:219 start_codon:yes stop_codon:yes gene_type:complete